MALLLCNGYLRVKDLPIKWSKKYYRNRRSRSPKQFCELHPGVIWASGHSFLIMDQILPQWWEGCAQCSPYHAVCQLGFALCLTGRTMRSAVGCFTAPRAVVVLPHTGPQEALETIQGAICTYTHSHPPAHLHAHPASAFNLICFLMPSENYTKTYDLQNGDLSLKCLSAWVFGSKGYFSLIELQRFQYKVWAQFFSTSTPNTRPLMHVRTSAPCTEDFFFLHKDDQSPLPLHSHVPITEDPVPIND